MKVGSRPFPLVREPDVQSDRGKQAEEGTRNGSALDGIRFVFVGGPARAGTTLVQKVLDLHSEVYGGPELGILPKLMETYGHLSNQIERGKLTPMRLDHDALRLKYGSFLRSLYSQRLGDFQGRYVSEKTPGNELAFDLLADVFGDARFVWVIRDPRDILCSRRNVQVRARRQGLHLDLGTSVHSGIQDIRISLAAAETFGRRHRDRLLVVRYEDLVAEPRRIAGSICGFLELEFEESMLETVRATDISQAISNAAPWEGPYYSVDMFDRNIDGSNVGRWKRELNAWQRWEVRAQLGGRGFQSLDGYGIGTPSAVEKAVSAGWSFCADAAQAVARRLRRSRS